MSTLKSSCLTHPLHAAIGGGSSPKHHDTSVSMRRLENKTNIQDRVLRGKVYGIPCPSHFTWPITHSNMHIPPCMPKMKRHFTYARVYNVHTYTFSHNLYITHMLTCTIVAMRSADGIQCNMQHAICMNASCELLEGKRCVSEWVRSTCRGAHTHLDMNLNLNACLISHWCVSDKHLVYI